MKHTTFLLTCAAALLHPVFAVGSLRQQPANIIHSAKAMTEAQQAALAELSKVSIRVENARIDTKGAAPMLRCELVFLHQGSSAIGLHCHGIHIRTAASGRFTLDGHRYDYTPERGKLALEPGKELRLPVALPVKQKSFRSIRYAFPVVSMETGGRGYDIADHDMIQSQP